ncbi:DEAD/DEAH box helicase family protein [Helicobacter sp. MIT 01-3238]|uniref:DEAD/DEAH box helicase family protein n=1 Tax=Helicobacter sp. MIT 01-3238 TaxID=398627 RepID=UPI000E1F745A|nr:DEAD/DEAH box helicase family protein [Helicobacter sp. MIT 01-3238]RDU52924.1 hypothetical protein CQA40_06385 [Helicobacter sp. MIT 01-3238]
MNTQMQSHKSLLSALTKINATISNQSQTKGATNAEQNTSRAKRNVSSNDNRGANSQNRGKNQGNTQRGESLRNNDRPQNADTARSEAADSRTSNEHTSNNVQEIPREPRESSKQGDIQRQRGHRDSSSDSNAGADSRLSTPLARDDNGQLPHTDNNIRGGGWGDIRSGGRNIDGGIDDTRHQQRGNISSLYESGQLNRIHTTTRSDGGLGRERLGGRGGGGLSADEAQIFDTNVKALEILNQSLGSSEPLSSDEINTLKAFSGAGGRFSNAIQKIRKANINDERLRYVNDLLKSIDSKIPKRNFTDRPLDIGIFYAFSDTAYYTPKNIVKAMGDFVKNLSPQKKSNILEPSCGVGRFLDEFSGDEYNIYGVELDRLTAAIAQKIYPNAHIENEAFEKSKAAQLTNSYDIVIGNPPYSSDRIAGMPLADYFMLKGIDNLADYGISIQIVSHNFLDKDSEAKNKIAEQAEFLGAVRLPDTAFGADTGVTTDIVAFRKVPLDQRESLDKSWTQTQDSEFKGLKVSSYFANNPNNVLGAFIAKNTRFGKQLGVIDLGTKPSPLDNLDLARYISLRPAFLNAPQDLPKAYKETRTNYENKPIGSIFLRDGKVYRATNENDIVNRGNISKNVVIDLAKETELRKHEWTKSANALQKRIDLYVQYMPQLESLQETLGELRYLEANSNDEVKIELLRAKLNEQFNQLTKNTNGSLYDKRGYVRKEFSLFFHLDDTSFEVFSLQDKDGQKAQIFEKRMAKPYEYIESADSLESAVNISKNEFGTISIPRVSELLNQDSIQTQKDLLDSKIMYMDYSGAMVEAGEFLSGDVKSKLEYFKDPATKAFKISDNELEAKYQKIAFDDLKEVIPEDIELNDISISLGANWIEKEIYQDFLQNHLGISLSRFSYTAGVGYEIEANQFYTNSWDNYTFATNKEFAQKTGKETDNALYHLEKMFNNATLEVSRSVKMPDGSQKTYKDEVGTATLERFKKQLQKDFKEFLESKPEYAEAVQKTYNELFNRNVTRVYSGKHLTLIGKNDDISLRPHQQAGVQRVLDSKNTLLAHDVGTGKTYTMVASALESKRIGISKKPMLVTPNNVAPQLAAEARKLYPNAKIKLINAISQKTKNIELDNLKNNDYDLIVATYTAFSSMNVSTAMFQDYYEKEIEQHKKVLDDLKKDPNASKQVIRSFENKIKKTGETIANHIQNSAKSETRVFFDDLGVDMMLFDEAQKLKNLPVITAQKNVRGISTAVSQRAVDAYMKIKHLQQEVDNSKVVFATGTPITNYISDMYILQRYLGEEELSKQGNLGFDDWCKNYALSSSSFERKASGEFKQTSRLKEFQNIPELKKAYSMFADVVTKEDMKKDFQARGLKSPEPKVERYNLLIERSSDQAMYQEVLKKRSKDLEGKRVEKGGDNHLVIMNDGKKASLDMRLINPNLERDPNGKVAKCAEVVLKQYEQYNDFKGTQLIFCDSSTPKGKSLSNEEKEKTLARIIELEDELDDFKGKYEDLEKKQAELETLQDKYDRGTGGFSVYEDMKSLLIEKGIPENEIAFIHDYHTEHKANILREKINNGEIRILLGSTHKMGAGSNFQAKLTAIHHLDFDWTPANMEQREGRIIRQGNEIHKELGDDFSARIFTYATKASVDSVVLQTLGVKQNIIKTIGNPNQDNARIIVDDSEDNLYAAMQAATDENAEILLEAMEIQKSIDFLQTEIDGNKKIISLRSAEVQRYKKNLEDFEAKEKFLDRFEKCDSKDVLTIGGGVAAKRFELNYTDKDKEKSSEIRAQIRAEFNKVMSIKVRDSYYSRSVEKIGSVGNEDILIKYHKDTDRVSIMVGKDMQEGVEFASVKLNDMFSMDNMDYARRYANVFLSEKSKTKDTLAIAKNDANEKIQRATLAIEKAQAKDFSSQKQLLKQKQQRLAELNIFLGKNTGVDDQIAKEVYGEEYENVIKQKIGAEIQKIKEANRLASANEVIASIDFTPKKPAQQVQQTQASESTQSAQSETNTAAPTQQTLTPQSAADKIRAMPKPTQEERQKVRAFLDAAKAKQEQASADNKNVAESVNVDKSVKSEAVRRKQ